MLEHREIDSHVHHVIMKTIVDRSHAPSVRELSAALSAPEGEVRGSLSRLVDNHGLVLHPGSFDVWIAHPFSLSPTAVWVASGARGWWAPCLWCAMGVIALTGGEGSIHARLGGEQRDVAIQVRGGRLLDADLLAHFALPPRQAWNNVIHFCAMVLPFRSEAAIDEWCARHRLPRGEAVPLLQVYALSEAWYGRHLDHDWRKWTAAEAQAVFAGVGLTSPFWALSADQERF